MSKVFLFHIDLTLMVTMVTPETVFEQIEEYFFHLFGTKREIKLNAISSSTPKEKEAYKYLISLLFVQH